MSSITKVHPAMIDARFVIGLSGTANGDTGTGSGGTGPVGPTGPAGPQGPAGSANSAVGVGSSLPSTGTEGQAFYNTTDSCLYIYHNGAWVKASSAITGNAPSGIEIVSSLPASGTPGQVVYNKTDDKLYEWSGTAWVASAPTIAATQITDGSITTPKLAANAITSDKLAANSIVAGKIAAGAIGATELAAGAVTAGKLAANSVTAGTIAAGIITATNLAAGAVTVDKLSASTTSVNVSGVNYTLGGNTTIFGSPVCFLLDGVAGSLPLCTSTVNATSAGLPSMVGLSGTRAGDHAIAAYGGVTGSYSSSNPTFWSQVMLSYNGYSSEHLGMLVNVAGTGPVRGAQFTYANQSTLYSNTAFTATRTVTVCTETYGLQLFGSTIGSFTGAHDAFYLDADPVYEFGDIMVDREIVGEVTVNDSISIVKLSDAPNMKTAIGIVSTNPNKDHTPSALSTVTLTTDEEGKMSSVTSVNPEFVDMMATFSYIAVNAVGEGGINVCGENGDIEAGDLIVTSSIPGKGMKQDDDIVRAKTVAKARQSVKFSSPEEVKFIACVYLCG